MRIGLDIMGGDYAPEPIVAGAIDAHAEFGGEHTIVLFGDADKGKAICQARNFDPEHFEWVHATQVIGMGEFPARAFTKKPDSSIAVAYKYLHSGKIDVFASAGNTGAMLVGAMYTIKPIPGIIRPAISAILPRPDGKNGVILDVGLNVDSKPDVLYQYGVLGSIYAREILNIEQPRVALLNIGEEPEKGNVAVQSTYESMKGTDDFHFVGNMESSYLFTAEKADVVVCDGFVGNVVMKEAEAFYAMIKDKMPSDANGFMGRFDFERIGGTPILGVNANVIIGHGVSREKATKQMVAHAIDISSANLPNRFKEIFLKWLK